MSMIYFSPYPLSFILSAHPSPKPLPVVVSGILALAIAMGMGRFSFTPLMPLMIRDGSLDALHATEWAAINYLGYLLGALTASRFAANPRKGLAWGLAGIFITSLIMAFITLDLAFIGGLMRGLSGLFSAWVLVCASSWCLPELARLGFAAKGAWIYLGVGLGITVTGLLTWFGGNQPAVWLWLELSALVAAGMYWVYHLSVGMDNHKPTAASGPAGAPAPAFKLNRSLFSGVFCYGSFGFGYIIPATYLPMMAHQLVSDPLVFGLTWPVFGLAAMASVAFSALLLSSWPRTKVWAIAQAVMALGTATPLLGHSILILAVSALLVGGTFMVTTMAGLQWAREMRPNHPAPLLARMTTAFATGQILGPVLVRLFDAFPNPYANSLELACATACLLLVISSLMLWRRHAGESAQSAH